VENFEFKQYLKTDLNLVLKWKSEEKTRKRKGKREISPLSHGLVAHSLPFLFPRRGPGGPTSRPAAQKLLHGVFCKKPSSSPRTEADRWRAAGLSISGAPRCPPPLTGSHK
jgi:hypothetical protein